MFLKIDQDPSRSINQIYEEVRNSTTQTMTTQEKQSFLSVFPSFRQIQAKLYRKRRELIPPNPKRMTDLKLDLPLFQYSQEKTVVKGDQVLDDRRRVVLFTTNEHLKHLAKSQQVLADGTFRITPKLWTQTFIIFAQVYKIEWCEASDWVHSDIK